MARKRSRPATEARIRDAVRQLVADEGCGGLGVNSIADRAGSDKVLIYRYFGSLDGLLRSVAEDRPWLPDRAAVLAALPSSNDGARILEHCARSLRRALERDPAAGQLMRWRHAVNNPLTRTMDAAWNEFWEALAETFARGQGRAARTQWEEACALAALATESAVNGRPLDPACYERIAGDLTVSPFEPSTAAQETNEALPTNLL